MGVNMKAVKELRQRTSAGVLDCKKALNETDGDVEKAVDYLREKGMSDAADKAGRTASEGKVNILLNDNINQGVIVEVNSETDFVAKNDKFKKLVDKITQHIMKSNADNVDELLEEPWYKDEDQDVNTVINEAIASIGENINLRRFDRYSTNGFLQAYIHLGGKIGVLVDFDGELNDDTRQTAKNIAMHIAASNPQYVSREEVSDNIIEKEKEIYKEQMLNEGKPEHIIDNIVEGKMNKFFTQICLLEQPFVRDEDITVGELLEDSTLNVNDFTRYELGEGIEEEEEDFASEVMAEMNKE